MTPDSPIFGTLIKRYKRFMVDVALENGHIVTAHCPNSGKMMGILEAGNPVILTHSGNTNRKFPLTWEAVRVQGVWIGTNTHRTNLVAKQALMEKRIAPLAHYSHVQQEVPYGKNSRIDFLLTGHDLPNCYVEVKNVHLIRTDTKAEFPDCITERGTKHMGELTAMVDAGFRCVVLYIVQRQDATCFDLAEDLDPAYAKAAKEAHAKGVEVMAYNCHITTNINNPFCVTVLSHLDICF
jgi:sugar fermentation stimulation protein A